MRVYSLLPLLICGIFAFISPLAADEYERTLSISEWVQEMETSEEDVYVLKNAKIVYQPEDSVFTWRYSSIGKRSDYIHPKRVIESQVFIKDCQFPKKSIVFNNFIFKQNVTITKSNANETGFRFENSQFKEGLDIHHFKASEGIDFDSCVLVHGIFLINVQASRVTFYECSMSVDTHTTNGFSNQRVESRDKSYRYLLWVSTHDNNIKSFTISDCQINALRTKPIISFQAVTLNHMFLTNTKFSNAIVSLPLVEITKSLTIENCVFTQPIGVKGLILPEENTLFRWRLIDKPGLGLYNNTNYNQPPYTARPDSQLQDTASYYTLMRHYNQFYDMYKTQGDRESANACYIAKKEMETRRHGVAYRQNPTFRNFINYYLNVFLKHFAKYGTSPTQAIIISFYIILIFAAIYFVTHSKWDHITRSFLIQKLRRLSEYFRSENNLEDYYDQAYATEMQAYEQLKEDLEQNRQEHPFFIRYLAKPLHLLVIIPHRLMRWLYRSSDPVQGRWRDLSPLKKAMVGSAVLVFVMSYIVYLLLIRAINAFTLSLNVFVTLGFGMIPVYGVARYLAIFEGFMGWFLLSVFSVTLINQILQF